MAANGSVYNGPTVSPPDIRLGMIEVRPFRPFKSSEEYLYAMKEDLAEWLNSLYELDIHADNFCEVLETGVMLCRHANNVRRMALDYLGSDSRCRLPYPVPAKVTYREQVLPGTFLARDNVSNFISWCRAIHILECLLFETDDLVLRKNEKSFILCLLEVARRGSKVGMPAPLLVQMEEEIDREIALDNAKRMRECGVETDPWPSEAEVDLEPPRQIITNDLKSLDEMVRDLVNRCTCPVQFPMIRISEGKYRIGDTKILIFVRILRNHVMVRVGGGWDTLAHYLDKHDPCRCRQGHRNTVYSKLTVKYPSAPGSNINNQTEMVIDYERSPVSGNGTVTNGQPTLLPRNRSISPYNYQQPHQGSPPRVRRASTSSTSSHELSTESSITGEPSMVTTTVGSDDSNYSSIRVTPPSQQRANELSLDSEYNITAPSRNSNGDHDVNDFANGVQHTSTPTDDAPALNGKNNNVRKSRIQTCAEILPVRKKTPPNTKNGPVNVDNNNVSRTKAAVNVTNPRRTSSNYDSRLMPRSNSHTDDFYNLSNGLSRSQDIRRSCRLPRSPSAPWTPAANHVATNGNSDKNRTWSGFKPGVRLRPSISPDIFDMSRNNSNLNVNYNNNKNNSPKQNSGSTHNYNRPQTTSFQSSPAKHCPALLRELLCDTNLDTDEKVMEKIEKIIANRKQDSLTSKTPGTAGDLKMAPEDAVLTGEKDEDYTKRWLTDVGKFSKNSPASSQGIASPDYGSDFGCELGGGHSVNDGQPDKHHQTSTLTKNKKIISMASPRKNNHPASETKIPMPIY